MPTLTKGNVVVENIKIGDIHYEFGYGIGIKSEVISLPKRSEEGYWTWQSRSLLDGRIIDYGTNEKYPHYGLNIYDYEAYKVKTWI